MYSDGSDAFFLLRNLLISQPIEGQSHDHALTGGADVKGWFISSSVSSSLALVQMTRSGLGYKRAFDSSRFFCVNVPGSPYETASLIMLNPDTGSPVCLRVSADVYPQ